MGSIFLPFQLFPAVFAVLQVWRSRDVRGVDPTSEEGAPVLVQGL